jgi:hypothetical protein
MAVVILEYFGGGFGPCVGTEPLREQAEFCEAVFRESRDCRIPGDGFTECHPTFRTRTTVELTHGRVAG